MAPRGVYAHKGFVRITKEMLNDFIRFCHREDIHAILSLVKRPHQLAVKLYEKETGIKITLGTAYKNIDRIMYIYERGTKNDDHSHNASKEYEEEINEHKKHTHKRMTKDSLKDYIRFTFRDDIASILKDENVDIMKRINNVVRLYEMESGIKMLPKTAFNQIGRWKIINDEVVEFNSKDVMLSDSVDEEEEDTYIVEVLK